MCTVLDAELVLPVYPRLEAYEGVGASILTLFPKLGPQ